MRIVGIYCYRDKKDNSIVYVGKDSNIEKNIRHKSHIAPSNYNSQPFNRVLQNNPNRYKYEVLKSGDFKENLLNALEIIYIKRYNPKFNFTVGGDGCTGLIHTEATKKKISKTKKRNFKYTIVKAGFSVDDNQRYAINDRNNKILISSINKEYLESFLILLNSWEEKGLKLIENKKSNKKKHFKPKYLSDRTKRRIFRNYTCNYAKINKGGKTNNGKKNYIIYMDGKIIKRSIYPYKLLDWFTKEYPKEILILNNIF